MNVKWTSADFALCPFVELMPCLAHGKSLRDSWLIRTAGFSRGLQLHFKLREMLKTVGWKKAYTNKTRESNWEVGIYGLMIFCPLVWVRHSRDHQPPSNSICSVEKQISNENTHSNNKHIAQPSLLCVLTRVFHEINNRKLFDLNFLAKRTLGVISDMLARLGLGILKTGIISWDNECFSPLKLLFFGFFLFEFWRGKIVNTAETSPLATGYHQFYLRA